jgi:sugar-specific transcriptional regulator TrmB
MKAKLFFLSALAFGTLILLGSVRTGKMSVRAANAPQSIVNKLVEKFNLNKDEVTGVFDEEQKEHQQKRQADMEERLNKAVTDGVITADQKQVLLNKQQEMEEKRTREQEEMQNWIEQSGIDFEKLAPYRVGFGGGPGFGKGHPPGGF